jgi:hypothetical protein
MAIFKNVAVVRLVGLGGPLNSIMADSTDSSDIHTAMQQLLAEGVFEVGDRIEIEEVETEVV